MKPALLCLVFVSAGTALVRAQDAPKPVKLTVSPAPEPEPALKYALLPTLSERKPGNAALLYYRAMQSWQSAGGETHLKMQEWLFNTERHELPDAARALIRDAAALKELDLAARRERCDWLLPIREQGAFAVSLPEAAQLRELGRLQALRIRLEITDGAIDDAIQSLKTGYSLAYDTNQANTLIHALVGTSTGRLLIEQAEQLVQRDHAPNLYWALTALPQPLINLRGAIEQESDALYGEFPILRRVDGPPLSAGEVEELRRELGRFFTLVNAPVAGAASVGSPPEAREVLNALPFFAGRDETLTVQLVAPQEPKRGDIDALAQKLYPRAKQFLIDRGRSAQQVDELPVLQAVTLYSLSVYEMLRDRHYRWFHLPYWEARAGLEDAERYLSTEGKRMEGIPFATYLLPATSRSFAATTRLDRDVALLRCVEAIRMYAATHDGNLPERLADITQVPVPEDPYTGQGFSYSVQGDVATLESAAPEGFEDQGGLAKRYRITIRR